MKSLRIMVVCGFGLGSSMMLKMKLDAVLKANGVEATTFCADITTATGEHYDLVFTSKELLSRFQKGTKPAVAINNFLSEKEITEKGLPVIEQALDTQQ